MKIKRRCPKRKIVFYRQRRTVAAAAALVICIGAAGIAQWRLHSEEPGPEMAAYDMTGLSAEDGIALQAEDAAAVTPDAGENQGTAADQNAVQGRMANNAETCFAEIYLEIAKVNSEKLPGGLSMKATQKPSAGEQIIRWNVSQKTVGKLLKIPTQL